ncbi:MAG: hypothetical protein KBD31_05620 [Proteobacteria bacterium]|nr:hypothetical protein [Pseudomonadota bacterium]
MPHFFYDQFIWENFMSKKILMCALAAMGAAHAKVNVGLVLQGSFVKPKTTFFGSDDFAGNTELFSNDIRKAMNAFGGGFLLGYEVDSDKPFKTVFEVDVQFFNKKLSSGTLIAKNTTGMDGNILDRESFTFKKKMEVGFNPSFAYAMNGKFDALFGVRFNVSTYDLAITSATGTIPSTSFWTMGIEPNVGGRFKINEKMSARFSLGYNFAQKYTKAGYVTDVAFVQIGSQGNVSFQPSGVNVRAAVTYSFS